MDFINKESGSLLFFSYQGWSYRRHENYHLLLSCCKSLGDSRMNPQWIVRVNVAMKCGSVGGDG